VKLALMLDSAIINETLLPGMVAKVNMLSQSHEGFIIPSYCIQNGQNRVTCWVIDNNVATRRDITVGSFVGDNVFVADGLNQGDMVVTSGYQKLYNGAKVEVSK